MVVSEIDPVSPNIIPPTCIKNSRRLHFNIHSSNGTFLIQHVPLQVFKINQFNKVLVNLAYKNFVAK